MWRVILIRSNIIFIIQIVIAQSISRKEIEEDWTWLQDTMMATLGEIMFIGSSLNVFDMILRVGIVSKFHL